LLNANAVRSALRERTRPGVWRFSLLVFAAAALLSISRPAASDPAPASGAEARILNGRVVGVTDGDTLTLLVDREQVRIRLAQIDAPESNQPYGKKAKAALSTLAFGKQARVEVVDIDRYGRTVGEIFVGEIDINHEMVREGHAWAYTKYSHTTEIIELEDSARTAKKGLWALPENQREPPWIWRHTPRDPQPKRGARHPKPGPLVCGTRTYCGEMADCEVARFYFEKCGVQSLDGDGDGIPCESLCAADR
jgi:endonuclease YncB( thermonuclease family)